MKNCVIVISSGKWRCTSDCLYLLSFQHQNEIRRLRPSFFVEGRCMAKDFAKAFYKSKVWRQCREGFIRWRTGVDGGMCQRCGERLGYIVHHKEWISQQNIHDPLVLLCWDNLEYVCKPCHDDEHLPSHQPRRLLCSFDMEGRPVNACTEERP